MLIVAVSIYSQKCKLAEGMVIDMAQPDSVADSVADCVEEVCERIKEAEDKLPKFDNEEG